MPYRRARQRPGGRRRGQPVREDDVVGRQPRQLRTLALARAEIRSGRKLREIDPPLSAVDGVRQGNGRRTAHHRRCCVHARQSQQPLSRVRRVRQRDRQPTRGRTDGIRSQRAAPAEFLLARREQQSRDGHDVAGRREAELSEMAGHPGRDFARRPFCVLLERGRHRLRRQDARRHRRRLAAGTRLPPRSIEGGQPARALLRSRAPGLRAAALLDAQRVGQEDGRRGHRRRRRRQRARLRSRKSARSSRSILPASNQCHPRRLARQGDGRPQKRRHCTSSHGRFRAAFSRRPR